MTPPLNILSAYDIVRLSNADWTSVPFRPRIDVRRVSRPSDLLGRCTQVEPGVLEDPRTARRAPWVATNHGSLLIVLAGNGAPSQDIVRGFWKVCTTRPVYLGTCAPLAALLLNLLDTEPRRVWFDCLAREVEQCLDNTRWALSAGQEPSALLGALWLQLARRVRQTEVTSPRFAAALALYVSVRAWRWLSHDDLLRAWNDAQGDVQGATDIWMKGNADGSLRAIELTGVLLHMSESSWATRLAPADEQALARLARLIQAAEGLHQQGLLAES